MEMRLHLDQEDLEEDYKIEDMVDMLIVIECGGRECTLKSVVNQVCTIINNVVKLYLKYNIKYN